MGEPTLTPEERAARIIGWIFADTDENPGEIAVLVDDLLSALTAAELRAEVAEQQGYETGWREAQEHAAYIRQLATDEARRLALEEAARECELARAMSYDENLAEAARLLAAAEARSDRAERRAEVAERRASNYFNRLTYWMAEAHKWAERAGASGSLASAVAPAPGDGDMSDRLLRELEFICYMSRLGYGPVSALAGAWEAFDRHDSRRVRAGDGRATNGALCDP